VTNGVLNVDNVERARVTLTVNDGTNSPQVTTTSNHAQISRVKLDEVHNFSSCNFQLNCVIDLDQRVRVANGAAIMGGKERDSLRSDLHTSNLAELVLQQKQKMRKLQYR